MCYVGIQRVPGHANKHKCVLVGMPKLHMYANKEHKCVLVACPGSVCMPTGHTQVGVLVGMPRLPMYANEGTHRLVPSNMRVCAPIRIHKEIRYSN